MYGLPTDLYAIKNRWVPRIFRAPFIRFMLERFQGKNEDIGLQKPTQPIFATHPTVNSELYYAVRHGKVSPQKDIKEFNNNKVTFIDGHEEEFDVVIACTGFRIKHSFFDKDFINYEEGMVPLLHRMIPADINNIYFIGLFQPLGCIWPGAELQSKLAANPDVPQLETPRHTITVDDPAFRERLKKELRRCEPALEI